MGDDDKQSSLVVIDLEKTRNKRRITRTLDNLLADALTGVLTCAAIRVYYKDGSSELKVIGGTPKQQAECRARLEAKEAEWKALREQLPSIVEEVFAHLPEEEQRLVLHSPERMKLALNTLPENLSLQLDRLTQERLTKCKELLDELYPSVTEK
jgi:hypothetical protein